MDDDDSSRGEAGEQSSDDNASGLSNFHLSDISVGYDTDESFYIDEWIGNGDTLDLVLHSDNFEQVAAALSDPSHAGAVRSINCLVLAPGVGYRYPKAAQQVADFLDTTKSLTRISIDYSWVISAEGENDERNRIRRTVDQWLMAIARNSDMPLEVFRYHRLPVASDNVFADFARAKLSTVKLEVDSSLEHANNLGVYLDPTLEINSLSLQVHEGHANLFRAQIQRFLPAATALRELSLDFPQWMRAEFDCSIFFSAPSVHTLSLTSGLINSAPAQVNATVRKLSLTATRLGRNASRVLGRLTSLESLSVIRCSIEDERAFSLQQVLNANLQTLNKLELEVGDSSLRVGAHWQQDVLHFVRESRILECLIIKHVSANEAFLDGLGRHVESDACRLRCLVFEPTWTDLRTFFSSVARAQSLEHFLTNATRGGYPNSSDALIAAYQANMSLVYPPMNNLHELHYAFGTEDQALAYQLMWLQQLNICGWGHWLSNKMPLSWWPTIMAQMGASDVVRDCRCPHCGTFQRLKIDAASVGYAVMRAMPSLVLPIRRSLRRRASDG